MSKIISDRRKLLSLVPAKQLRSNYHTAFDDDAWRALTTIISYLAVSWNLETRDMVERHVKMMISK